MANQNIADISTFESLQSEAHQLMGFSSLSVFNATFKIVDKEKAEFGTNPQNIKDWTQKFIEAEKSLIKTKPELKPKEEDFKKKEKAYKKKEDRGYYKSHKKETDKTYQEYSKAQFAYAEIKRNRDSNRSNMKKVIKDFKDWGVEVTTDVNLEED